MTRTPTPAPAPFPPDLAATPDPTTVRAWGPDQVAAYLRISRRGLSQLRGADPTFPQPRMVGRLPRWAPAQVIGWLDTSPPSTPDPAAATTRRSRAGAGRVR